MNGSQYAWVLYLGLCIIVKSIGRFEAYLGHSTLNGLFGECLRRNSKRHNLLWILWLVLNFPCKAHYWPRISAHIMASIKVRGEVDHWWSRDWLKVITSLVIFTGFSLNDWRQDIVTGSRLPRQMAPWFICFANCEAVSKTALEYSILTLFQLFRLRLNPSNCSKKNILRKGF